MIERKLDKKLFAEARKYLPGGVNSPVRAFKAVGGPPVFIRSGQGARIYGEDGKAYIDFCLSWGALILGHAHRRVSRALRRVLPKGTSYGTATKSEIELAKLLVGAFPSIERVRLTNSGTEAAMSAVRLAMAYTRRRKVIKFAGAYHGAGIPEEIAAETIVAPYNDLARVKKAAGSDVAAILVEPVAGNMGVVLPRPGFLGGLRKICDQRGIILIFDEVITGFRFCFGGAQNFFQVVPDLTSLGKIIGGGLPAGAFGGKKQIMQLVAPRGDFVQAGTFAGNPATVVAGLATLKYLKKSGLYDSLSNKTRGFCQRIEALAQKHRIALQVNNIGAMFSLFFSDQKVANFEQAKAQDLKLFSRFYHALLAEGIYFSPSGLEANFVSLVHSTADLEKALKAMDKIFKILGPSTSLGARRN